MEQDAQESPSALESSPEVGPPERTHALLEHPVRRRLIAVLGELDTPERLSALTRSLAAIDDPAVPDDTERVRIQLYHAHVPKLVETGAATVDENGTLVELTEAGQAIADALRDWDRPRRND